MYRSLVKPLVDFIIASFAIVVLSPVFLLIAMAVKLDSRGPVLFKQERLGKDGRVFRILKFRSMSTTSTFKTNKTLSTDPRITKVGRFIRKTSLDEIPQLINVIRGEMSFIGPRPPLTNFPVKFEDYNDFDRRRFDVKPGISGLAAIRQREVHDWYQNFPLDVEYVENMSLRLDIKLFFLSLFTFFNTKNIYSPK
jgi:lipopolysaccharide/colanic/teichoic acid biosynthesis glycosyltransferase